MSETIRTSYKFYKEKTDNPVSLSVYTKITAAYIKFLMDKVFDQFEVTFPFNLGTLSIQGVKEKVKFDEDGKVIGLSPNWRLTKQLWDRDPKAKEQGKKVYNTNEHTGGIRYRFLWSKKRILIPYKTIYALRLSKDNKRRLYDELLEGKEFYSKKI